MIFDFDKSDGTVVNGTITPDSEIEETIYMTIGSTLINISTKLIYSDSK